MNEALVETSILVVVFGHSVLASSLRPHGLQHNQISLSFAISQSLLKLTSFKPVRLSNHLILCHPLLLLPSIFPSIQVFSNESEFVSGGQNIGVSASASVLPMNIQDWFLLELTGWIPLQSKGFSSFFSNTTVHLYNSALTSTHDYWKNHSFD